MGCWIGLSTKKKSFWTINHLRQHSNFIREKNRISTIPNQSNESSLLFLVLGWVFCLSFVVVVVVCLSLLCCLFRSDWGDKGG